MAISLSSSVLKALGFKSREVSNDAVVRKDTVSGKFIDGEVITFPSNVVFAESRKYAGAYAVFSTENRPIYISSLVRTIDLVNEKGAHTGKTFTPNTAFYKDACQCWTASEFATLLSGKSLKVTKVTVDGVPTFEKVGEKWSVSGCEKKAVATFEYVK
jgi:hypothetical protein